MFELSDARRGFLVWGDMLRFRLKFLFYKNRGFIKIKSYKELSTEHLKFWMEWK